MEATSGAVVVFVVRGGGLPEFSLEGDYVVIRWAGAFSEFEHILGPTLHPSGPTLESNQDLHGGSTVRVCVYLLNCTCRFLCVCVFLLLSLELGRCSSDLFLSSRPRTGLATTCITGYG